MYAAGIGLEGYCRTVAACDHRIIINLRDNVTKADSVQVVKMRTAEPFTKRLLNRTPKAYLWWCTKCIEHMTRHKTYTSPTFLVTQEIREILTLNNGFTVEPFHKVKPDEFIYMVTDEIRCFVKRHFTTVILEGCSVYSPVPFHKVLPNTHRDNM